MVSWKKSWNETRPHRAREASNINQNRNPQRAREFLEICFDVFCQHGLENTSLKMLSEACGVSNAAPGATEHNLGLSADIMSDSEQSYDTAAFEATPEYQ